MTVMKFKSIIIVLGMIIIITDLNLKEFIIVIVNLSINIKEDKPMLQTMDYLEDFMHLSNLIYFSPH